MKLKPVFVFLLLSLSGFAQTQQLQDLSVDAMRPGYFYAGSRVVDKEAFGGFSTSYNFPLPIDPSMDVPRGSVSIIAFPDTVLPFEKRHKGMRVIVTNATPNIVGFDASDSRLYIMQEALDTDGKWKPIEYLPRSWCGNSYHTVFLEPNEYWEFAAARYTGQQPTMLRIRMTIGSSGKRSRVLLSNEFEGSINPSQFKVPDTPLPGMILDPYD